MTDDLLQAQNELLIDQIDMMQDQIDLINELNTNVDDLTTILLDQFNNLQSITVVFGNIIIGFAIGAIAVIGLIAKWK